MINKLIKESEREMIDVNKLSKDLNLKLNREQHELLDSIIRAYGNLMFREGCSMEYNDIADYWDEEDFLLHKEEELLYNKYKESE